MAMPQVSTVTLSLTLEIGDSVWSVSAPSHSVNCELEQLPDHAQRIVGRLVQRVSDDQSAAEIKRLTAELDVAKRALDAAQAKPEPRKRGRPRKTQP